MTADLTRSAQHIVEQLVGVTGGTYDDVNVKGFLKFTGATANPADSAALSGGITGSASLVTPATITCTGVAVGDIVVGVGVVSGLAANSYVLGAYVSATDTVTVMIGTASNSAVTTTAVTVNLIVADVT